MDKQSGNSNRLIAYVGMGSNMGDSQALLRAAAKAMTALPGLHLCALSSIYKTEPQNLREQPFFLNRVAALDCPAHMDPQTLLDALQNIEANLGRDRSLENRFGPRPIDLDLLLFGNRVMTSERLTLPHPRMRERAFVLVPLAELAPDLLLPSGLTVSQSLARLSYRLEGDVILQNEVNML